MMALGTFKMIAPPVLTTFAAMSISRRRNRRGIAGDGHDILEVVFLESLKQKEGDHHQIIESLVGSEPLEWHLLGSKFFQSAVGQFIGAPLMVVIDQALVI